MISATNPVFAEKKHCRLFGCAIVTLTLSRNPPLQSPGGGGRTKLGRVTLARHARKPDRPWCRKAFRMLAATLGRRHRCASPKRGRALASAVRPPSSFGGTDKVSRRWPQRLAGREKSRPAASLSRGATSATEPATGGLSQHTSAASAAATPPSNPKGRNRVTGKNSPTKLIVFQKLELGVQ